ncbi:MAG: SDR family NAD(P)-dependent oxidoreductase [bacterium]
MKHTSFDISGKIALVTGASKGIGRSIALTLADGGADIIVTARNEEELKELVSEIKSMGRNAAYIVADLSSTKEAISMANRALEIFGKVDILVNNAGVSFPQLALEVTEEAWDSTMNVNLKSLFFITQVIGKKMIEQKKGKIINISSQAGIVGLEAHAAYCASKGGINLLTKVLAIEWGRYGINVNAVAPTVILTPMGERAWADPVKRAKMLEQIPIGRLGYPEDVSGVVLFLASSASDLITGAVIPVDGGYTAR